MMHFDLRVVLPKHPVLFFAVPPTVNDVDGHSYKKKQSEPLFLFFLYHKIAFTYGHIDAILNPRHHPHINHQIDVNHDAQSGHKRN